MRVKGAKYIVREELTLGGKNIVQYRDDVLQNFTLETCNFTIHYHPKKFN